MILAVEDLLSEAVARKMLAAVRADLQVNAVIGLRGAGYLRTKLRELNRTARSVPVLLVTDLDVASPCASALVGAWFAEIVPERNLLFRVAVVEVESWVLADRDRIAELLLIPAHRVPLDTDSIPDPKQFLVNLARKSRSKAIRDDLVPTPKSLARVGTAYNPLLTTFVRDVWSPRRAAQASRSLARALDRLRTAFRAEAVGG